MFNEANVDNRLRERIRGRVIVFTTSPVVEFLEESLRFSYPLYSQPATAFLDQGSLGSFLARGLSFMVELEGYLTFDAGSQVKIVEVGPFVSAYYDPTAFALVKPADPFTPVVRNVYISAPGELTVQLATDSSGNQLANYIFQLDATAAGVPADVSSYGENFSANWIYSNVLIAGSQFKGTHAYPGLTFLRIA